MTTPTILHCALTREDDGSVPYILGFHRRGDVGSGFRPRFVSFFDRGSTWPEGVTLAGHGWETIGALRRRFAAAARAAAADVAIYHDGWGVDWFAPLDGAARRIAVLHTERPHLDKLLRARAPQVDAFLSVSEGMADHVRRVLPDFPAERIRATPFFADAPAGLVARRPAGPVRFGYAGRIVQAQKRMERLPLLLAALDRRGVDYVFEVLGDGDYREKLQQRLRSHPRVKFLGWQKGADYWRTLAGWRAIVLLSDFEGLSRAMLEGMIAGAVPVHPDFSPAAAELLGPAASAGLYPVGAIEAAADRLAALARRPAAEVEALSAACRAHAGSKGIKDYFACFAGFVREILEAPSRARPVPPPRWHDGMLLGVYTRLFPLRF
ncbi:MAG TPA: glycosyltransferase [Opitutus sp.]|nr:glycosyltransferase [Opitutus sp.]